MMFALGFQSLPRRDKNWGYGERGKIFLFIMHEGDADYGYLLSIVGVF